MFEKMVRQSWNVLSGLFVLACSLWLSGPGIAETDTPDYRWYFMLWFLLWTIGFLLQFKKQTKWLGVLLTLIPTLFYLFLVLLAMELF
ncbi:hypothetical protein [Exiguobacterium sp.]|uniref:hypothetical protein n=1 Tax=Exiguobacterium sp. TaxID=44751 RepID=UPI00391BDAAC